MLKHVVFLMIALFLPKFYIAYETHKIITLVNYLKITEQSLEIT